MSALVTEGLNHAFGSLVAVREVALQVKTGTIHAIIGPNGAGKSTLLNLLAGTLKPSSGRIAFNGRDITALPVHSRARLGIARSYQVVNLFPGMTCGQVARLAVQRDRPLRAWFGGAGAKSVNERAEALLNDAGLQSFAEVETMRLSHGQQKCLEIALALANAADLLLLDEPMAGMAAHERIGLAARIRNLASTRTIVFVEHDIDMVMTLADTVTVLHNGSIVAVGTPAQVRADATTQAVYLGRITDAA